MEHAAFDQSASMICNSNFVSLGGFISVTTCEVILTTYIVRSQVLFLPCRKGVGYRQQRDSSEGRTKTLTAPEEPRESLRASGVTGERRYFLRKTSFGIL